MGYSVPDILFYFWSQSKERKTKKQTQHVIRLKQFKQVLDSDQTLITQT